MQNDIKARALEWMLSGDTGTSSETMLAITLGIVKKNVFGYDIPHDCGDFGRCYRLVKAIPEIEELLHEIPKVCPKWTPIVREWKNLKSAYEADAAQEPEYQMVSMGRGRKKQRCLMNKSRCYDLLKSLYDECMEADGFVKTGSHSWERGNSLSVSIGSMTIATR